MIVGGILEAVTLSSASSGWVSWSREQSKLGFPLCLLRVALEPVPRASSSGPAPDPWQEAPFPSSWLSLGHASSVTQKARERRWGICCGIGQEQGLQLKAWPEPCC